MTKLLYPEDGIYNKCRNDMENCVNDLSRAISNCYFDVPYDFRYSSYLRGLSNEVRNYYKTATNILYTMQSVSNNYENVSERLVMNSKKITPIKIVERDRLIN